jgi:zinc protease
MRLGGTLGSLALALILGAGSGVVHAAGTAATPLSPGVERGASVEGITEYRLTNGLRVLLFPDPSKPMATVNVTYLVGSRHEGYGETGMAHLLEHMLFKGSPKHQHIPDELTAHGTRPNGSTWYDRTNYHETFAATDENLGWALDLEADRMVNSYVAKKDLDSEMTVVRNEFEIDENSPQGVLLERVMSTAYLWHGYGRSTIGARADIENVPIENLQAFYRKWYQPDNAVLTVAGNFDEAKVLRWIQERFGAIPRPARQLPQTWTAEPAQDGERTVTLRRTGDAQAIDVAYHIPAGSHADFATLDVLAFVLGDTPAGRLHHALVETGKAASISSTAFQFRDPGLLILGAEVRQEKSLDEARNALIESVDDLLAHPATAEEVQRARDNLLRDWDLTMRNSQRVAIRLSEWASMGDWRLMFIHRDRLRAVTPADVQRVAATYLKAENRTVGIYRPTEQALRVEVPAAPDIAALVADYKGGTAMAQGESFDPAPAAIEPRLVRRTLPSGLKLTLLSKQTRGDVARVALSLHFGDEKSLQGRSAAAQVCGDMLMRGTQHHTRQQIQDEIDRLKARLGAGGGAEGASGSIEASRENLPAALRLLAEILREPSFPASELELLRQETLLQLEDSKTDPNQIASTAWSRYMQPWPTDDPRYVTSPEEDIERLKAVTLDQVRSFHQAFYGAAAGELAVVGDFDPAEIERLARELFGDWKPQQAYKRLASAYRARPAMEKAIETPDKEGAVFIGGQAINLSDEDPDYPALVLGNFMTGGGFLNSRLAVRLRQKDGLSYGAGSSFSASPWEKDAWFRAFAIYAPQNGEKLETAFKEEIARVLDKGFTDEEIAEAKKGWLQSRRVSRSQDPELARTLTGRDYVGRTLAWDEKLETAVSKLSAADILAAMRRHLDVSKMTLVQAGDFAKAKATAGASSQGGGTH